MADLRGFAAKMRATGQLVEENADRLIRRVALAVDTAVVMATPVDTGRARANWQAGLGASVRGVKYPAPAKPPTPEAAVSEAISQAREVIAKARGGGEIIHITNNLPYIKRLNEGSSRQAPAGFVEQSTLAAKNAVDTAGRITADVVTETI